ncbi:hypothetical protein P9250_03195 [Caballeronia sp. LP006]|jgi:hypothetical protein|uniref:hypothetical protein n=1 Tax=unclassified Caballeronia TaxID=2646786 RepID=UPI0020281211|nr:MULTISPECIES: hypothetical protein [unclassified Caballeronia]MDR5805619.1 hypothetical protein [Caballeronia sp. LZ001]MDR5826862.1 hypothetical protein [Caballeronia sp. LP006]
MSTSSRRYFSVARFAICACAIVGLSACGDSNSTDIKPPASVSAASSEAPTTNATSDLEDWAKQATSGAPVQAEQRGIARASSEVLATPVIHTVD